MPKAAITGHTLGLGKELSKLYPDHIGFTRESGYDISDWDSRHDIVSECKNADIIFNNAHYKFSQVDLLYDLFYTFKDTDKIIVNISSDSPEKSMHRPHKYAIEKLALDKACEQLQPHGSCSIILVKPGLFESHRSIDIKGHKMSAEYVAQQIKNSIETSCPSIINIQ